MAQSAKLIREYLGARNVLLDYLYTIIISIFIAAFMSISGISPHFFYNLVISQSFGISICSLILFLLWVIKPEKPLKVTLVLILGVIGGTLLGLQVGYFSLQEFFPQAVHKSQGSIFQKIIFALTFGGLISYLFLVRARIKFNQEEIQQERLHRLSKEKEALEAHLKLLQAQIEPHFLFNTLSNVLSLIDTDPPKGKGMLLDLIQYLRTSLSRTRHELTTLGEEMDLIKSYLNIFRIRMGRRLSFYIEMEDGLRDFPFPPMLIQPLVENAVKHGLEPKNEGGEIFIKAGQEGEVIRVAVADNGEGFQAFSEPGLGMANVRERLKLLFGDEARLIIEENRPKGVRVVIEVPKGAKPSDPTR
jgi:sensor histidine kinase YesM